MMQSLPRTIVSLLLFAISMSIYGQMNAVLKENLKFKHFASNEGLSQSSVVTIFQDSRDYIWIGTRDGLNKFDGYNFKQYRHNSRDSLSLSHSWITAIFEDSKGNLWVGTKDGLNLFNKADDSFKQFKVYQDSKSISSNEIWDIIEYNQKYILISTSAGVDVLDVQSHDIQTLSNFLPPELNYDKIQTRGFFITRDNNICITTINGIDLIYKDAETVEHYKYPHDVPDESHLNNSPVVFQDSHDRIWLGYDKGLAYFDPESDSFMSFKINGIKIKDPVRSIVEDYKGALWVGTYNGLYVINEDRSDFVHHVHNENDPNSLSQNSVYSIIQDSRGDMWIGTWAGGVNYYDRSYDNFRQLSPGNSDEMLNYKVVSSIVESGSDIWIATEGGGINILDTQTGKLSYLTHKENDPSSLSSNNVKSLIKDSNGNFWVGTHNNGLNFIDSKIKPYRVKRFTGAKVNGEVLSNFRLLSLKEDKHGDLWIGTLTSGLFHYKLKENRFIQVGDDSKSVTHIISDVDDNYLLIAGNNGVKRVNISTYEEFDVMLTSSHETKPITVNTLLLHNNSLWAGTEGEGIYVHNFETAETERYGIEEGLLNEVIYGLIAASDTEIWTSTNSGLTSIDIETDEVFNYSRSDGLQGNEFNYGAYLKLSNGDIVFGGTNGLNYFNPEKIQENTFIPKLDLISMELNDGEVFQLTEGFTEIELDYNQNDFLISYTALSYSQPTKNEYAYFLEGFDSKWNYTGNNRVATYTNLDEGEYTFRVKASNDSGLWNEKGASFKIKILPAPWKTWWAYLLYILTAVVLFVLGYRMVLIRIKEKEELKEERLAKERVEEVNNLKLKLFTNISHDFRTPLTLIIGPLERLLKRGTKDNFVQEQHEIMHRNAHMLMQLITQLLDFRKSEVGKMEIYVGKYDLVEFVNNIKIAFNQMAGQKEIEFQFSSNVESLEIYFDRIKLKKVLYNLLINAFKYTPDGGTIKLKLKQEADRVTIDVNNSGKLISPEHIEKIFDRFYRVDQESEQTGTGIGLSLCENMIQLHKGEITATSSAEEGTSFSFFIPTNLETYKNVNVISKKEAEASFTENYIEPFLYKHTEEAIIEDSEEQTVPEFELDPSKPTLLVVEDNAEVRQFVGSLFNDEYNICEAPNGFVGLEVAQKYSIDIIISDVMMPKMDGFEFCEKIKSSLVTNHIPIILLTAKTSDIHKKQGYHLGADGYVTKPFDANLLITRVQNLYKTRTSLISKFKKEIILEPTEIEVESQEEQFLKKAIEIIENNITDSEFNVQVFTEQMNMSKSALFRKVKKITGNSVSVFIRTIRIKRAGQLLVQSDLNVSEIAFDVGFNDIKYFRKCFKEVFNCTPSEYRSKKSMGEAEISQI